ncbi:MAG TPA: AmmeMemoRadiSam system protein A [Terriglobia bacterium]|nr:AmmeMemoRadiSam system protein A [Terriglobia bacterium]
MSPLSDEDGQRLLGIARQSMEEAVRGASPAELRGMPAGLLENAGTFVTLRNHSLLRGCIGHVEPNEPLARCVAECARAAALRDPRFAPVTAAELPDISIHISVLSPLFDIRPEEIEIGRHGLYVTLGLHRGILLPQVPVEWNWDRERFLSETCAKAGLPPDAWQHGARIQGFTTWNFADHRSPDVGAELASSHPDNHRS